MGDRDFPKEDKPPSEVKPLTHDLNTLQPIDEVESIEISLYEDGQARVQVNLSDVSLDGYAESLAHACAYCAAVYPGIRPKIEK